MKRIMILLFLVGVILSFTTISLEGIPVPELSQAPQKQKLKIYLDIAGEKELIPLVTQHLLESFRMTEDVNVVLEIENDVSYVVSVVLVEARAGVNKQKTDNIAACVQYIDYFDNSILKQDVAMSNWNRVNNLTDMLIEHTQTGLYLFSKDDLGKVTDGIVSKFQELFLERINN